MCTVVVLNRPGHAWPVILGANRDEMEDRAWEPPARHWPDRAEMVAGLDKLAGGTWLGINDFGVIAAVLNRRGSLGPKSGFRSRGELPLEALDHADADAAAQALAALDPGSYRPFNMVIADNVDAYWLRLAKGADGVGVSRLPSGVSMITSSDRNDLRSPRIATYLRQFEKAQEPDPETRDFESWRRPLAGRLHDPSAGPDGAMTIVTESGFATVSSSLMALPSPDSRGRRPIWQFCPGRPGEAPFEDVEI